MRERCRTAARAGTSHQKAEPDQRQLTGLCESKEGTLVDRTHILLIPPDIGKIALLAHKPGIAKIILRRLRLRGCQRSGHLRSVRFHRHGPPELSERFGGS